MPSEISFANNTVRLDPDSGGAKFVYIVASDDSEGASVAISTGEKKENLSLKSREIIVFYEGGQSNYKPSENSGFAFPEGGEITLNRLPAGGVVAVGPGGSRAEWPVYEPYKPPTGLGEENWQAVFFLLSIHPINISNYPSVTERLDSPGTPTLTPSDFVSSLFSSLLATHGQGKPEPRAVPFLLPISLSSSLSASIPSSR
ncbi:hypothetical protein N7530_008930 [Penicillium desertorum]|uniref:Uncharacterized protein n=1 Tax=Penicillium desertorum TaxID=1303715 RepID=A0A9W9WQP0_9EURO|nr:hypothetical protein N7530_008930 [Penicillium desertorum]